MSNKNVDIFKIVEEVNKRDANKDISDIYSMLDDLKEVKVDDVKKKVSSMSEDINEINKKVESSSVVVRPTVPNIGKDYDSRYQCFCDYIRKVDYGTSNSSEYVKGHKAALNKYLKEANNNKDDLYLIEASISDEIKNNVSGGSVFDKGYSDGLSYVHQSLKKSKSILLEKIHQEIKSKL